MAKNNREKKDRSKKAGLIAFGVTLLAYALIFPFNKILHFIIGGGVAALAGWIVKTMATPMKGLDKSAKSKEALDITIIEDEYARGIVEKGVEMLDTFKAERDAINEYVFTRRINELRENLDKVLRNIIEEPDEARHLRKMNSYYLPTTLKMLQSYRSAKSQGTSYMTISETREDVLGMLDKLNEALATLLDTMLKNDLENMDIEIEVFDRMLKSDGLREDEVTQSLRQSSHAAAREIPISKAPTVNPTAPVEAVKPVAHAVAAKRAAVQSAEAPNAEYAPESVTMDYEVQAKASANTPAPTLQVPGTTASARQLFEGAPVLHVPDSPTAPDFGDAMHNQSKA